VIVADRGITPEEESQMRNLGTIVALVLTVAASSASAQSVFTLTVGSGRQYPHISDAVTVANRDVSAGNYYVINLAPGTYINDFPTVSRPMTIQVDPAFAPQQATLMATVPLPNAKGIILTVSSLTVRGLVFTGAQISNDLGGNGAAIRDQNPNNTPASLVVDNSVFHDNQEGILQCCDADEKITIINSQFKNNGNPDPDFYQHGIYINQAANLTVVNSPVLRSADRPRHQESRCGNRRRQQPNLHRRGRTGIDRLPYRQRQF
jgi:hypothetical protein